MARVILPDDAAFRPDVSAEGASRWRQDQAAATWPILISGSALIALLSFAVYMHIT